MYELREVGVGRKKQDDVVERNGADKVEEEPRLDVVLGNLARLQDDLVGEIVGDDTCSAVAGARDSHRSQTGLRDRQTVAASYRHLTSIAAN